MPLSRNFSLNIFLLSFIFSTTIFSIPTAESVLRNFSNGELEKNAVKIHFIIKKDNLSGEDLASCELLFMKRNSTNNFGFIQKCLRSGSNDEDLVTISDLFSGLNESHLNVKNFEIFYSLGVHLFLNNPQVLIKMLRATDDQFVPNGSLLNYPKISLYKKFQDYLIKIKKNSELRDKLKSPLKYSVDDSYSLNELIKQPYYKENSTMAYEVEDGNPFLAMRLKYFHFLFTVNEHKMKSMAYKNGDTSFSIGQIEYQSMEKNYSAPSNFIVYDGSKSYGILFDLVKLQNISSSISAFQNKKSRPISDRPLFMNQFSFLL